MKKRNWIVLSLVTAMTLTMFSGCGSAETAEGKVTESKVTEATDEGTDTGPIILQKAVDVMEGDTPEILQRRVMEQAEWIIMPRAIDLIARGCVSVVDGKVHIAAK